MHKPFLGTVLTLLIGASALMCSGSGSTSTQQPDRFWAEFSPTYNNFQKHFDDNLDALDPIEGIWVAGDGQVAIIRSNIFEGWDYVAVALNAVELGPRRFSRGEIAITLANAGAGYAFQCASTLRGEACAMLPCNGAVTIAGGNMRAQSQISTRGECTPDNWLIRHPRR